MRPFPIQVPTVMVVITVIENKLQQIALFDPCILPIPIHSVTHLFHFMYLTSSINPPNPLAPHSLNYPSTHTHYLSNLHLSPPIHHPPSVLSSLLVLFHPFIYPSTQPLLPLTLLVHLASQLSMLLTYPTVSIYPIQSVHSLPH